MLVILSVHRIEVQFTDDTNEFTSTASDNGFVRQLVVQKIKNAEDSTVENTGQNKA